MSGLGPGVDHVLWNGRASVFGADFGWAWGWLVTDRGI